jgi:hypothetical protein
MVIAWKEEQEDGKDAQNAGAMILGKTQSISNAVESDAP